MDYSWEIIKIIFYLGLVIGIIYLFNYLLKKGFLQQKKGQYMRIIEQIYLAPKKSLILVKVKDKVLLLSISDNKVDKIREWDQIEFGELSLDSSPNFKEYFQKLIKGNRRDGDE